MKALFKTVIALAVVSLIVVNVLVNLGMIDLESLVPDEPE